MAPFDRSAVHFGPYRLLHELGAGGMGQVFLASQQSDHGIQRLVAVKRILAHLASDRKLVQLFLDEVRIAAQLNHGNIVQVVDHGCIDRRYYMAMEYVHGENLADVLERLAERDERLPLDLLLYLCCCVCEGLDHAHGKQGMDGRALEIVHRDISPHNVMLSFQGEVKIADFGVARAAEQTHQTLGGELRGKLTYMSPEQAFGRPLDRRSDLFSLGMVLYEALAGHNPVARDGPLATLEAVRAVDIAPLRSQRDGLPEELYELIDRLLSSSPQERPASARELHEHLQRIMRLHSMVVTAFDLADYLGDLFPESGGGRQSEGWQDRTAEGRRADALDEKDGTKSGPTEELVKRTLFYQRKRRPDGASLLLRDERALRYAGETAADGRPKAGVRWPSWLTAALAALLAGGAVAALAFYRQPSTPPVLADRDVAITGPVDAAQQRVASTRDAAARRDAHRPVVAGDAGVRAPRARLHVDSRPSKARLFIDGVSRGHTPLSLLLHAGQHRLRLHLPGYGAEPRSVLLRAGERRRVVVTLKARTAQLELSASHACALQVDGRAVGTLKAARTLAHTAGRLTLRCRYRDASAHQTLRLLPGEKRRLRFGFGVLTVNLQPWAKVTVNGKQRGDTPLRLVLPVGRHRVRLDNGPAGRHENRTVELREGQTIRLSSW